MIGINLYTFLKRVLKLNCIFFLRKEFREIAGLK